MPGDLRPRLAAVLRVAALGILLACPRQATGPVYPDAQVYEVPADFAGEWIGEVGGNTGLLRIDLLWPSRYRGVFRGEGIVAEYVLAMDQRTAPARDGEPRPANLVTFTWQDGRGGRGHGWLLINREDSALTGSYGEGDEAAGLGEWTFIRLE